MQYELDNKYKYYFSVPHKKWSDLMSTMEAKYNRKRSVDETKILSASKSNSANSGSNKSAKVTHHRKDNTGFLPDRKHQFKKNPKNKDFQYYCMLCNKAVMPERTYKSHISENCFGKRSGQESIK